MHYESREPSSKSRMPGDIFRTHLLKWLKRSTSKHKQDANSSLEHEMSFLKLKKLFGYSTIEYKIKEAIVKKKDTKYF